MFVICSDEKSSESRHKSSRGHHSEPSSSDAQVWYYLLLQYNAVIEFVWSQMSEDAKVLDSRDAVGNG